MPVSLARNVLGALVGGRADAARHDLREAVADERMLLGPVAAHYRGSTGGHPRAKASGTLVLTPTRVLFRRSVGGPLDVDLRTVTGVSSVRTFAGSFSEGQSHLVLHTADGDLAWFVPDVARWRNTVEAAISR
ncbi:hypothetical protein [Nocardioides sp. WS12]|uniref:hypothetical protein n=1 Tax=Nocardioides sp. WS12 TaxID=2486272 RepID=UPI0015FA2D1A|nr:hypothetical protein [Nocardioides sp. WS12]